MKKFHFVYITTNIINGKRYIGDRSCACCPEKDVYLGSGIYLKHAIKEYGRENFKREILELFCTKEKAFNAQEKYIKQYDTLVPSGYNISAKGGYGVPNSFLNEETKKKIGIKNKGENNGMWKKEVSIDTINKWKESHKNYRHSNETKQKQRIAHLGKKKSYVWKTCMG